MTVTPKKLGSNPRLVNTAIREYETFRGDMAAIYRKVEDQGTADGGTDNVYELITPDLVPASRWSAGGMERMLQQRIDVRMIFKIALPPFTDVTEADEILYYSRRGTIHHMAVIDTPDATHQRVLMVDCVEYPLMEGSTVSG